MNLTYVPRSQLREALLKGHRLVPGHEYRRDEYAILMRLPDGEAKPVSEGIIRIVEARFKRAPVDESRHRRPYRWRKIRVPA